MAEDSHRSSAAPEETPRQTRRFHLRRVVNTALERLQRNLLRNMAVFLAAVTSVVGLAVMAQYLTLSRPEPEREISLAAAFSQLEAGYIEQARETAVDLRRRGTLAKEELGAPAYVLGVAMIYDAEQRTDPGERQSLYLLAARYLEEAEQLGYPAERRGHGMLLLGKARFETGQFSACLAPLHESLGLSPENPGEIHHLLAEAYLLDQTPRLPKALHHIQLQLADPSLDEQSREAALLTAAEIQFQLGDETACRQMLAQLPEESRNRADALLMEGRMLMNEGDQLLAQPAGAEADAQQQAREKYRLAREAFTAAQQHHPGNGELVRKAQFLLGLAHRKLREYADAETRFSRTHRSNYDTAEGLAAGFEAADIMRLRGKHDEAIEAYGRVLRQARDMPVYSNPWIPLDSLRERSVQAFKDYFDRADFDRAIQMANALSPLLSLERALELQARAHAAEAQRLQQQVDQSTVADPDRLSESHAAWRRAAALYEELAAQRFATRQYPDLLWKSAESYLHGHDYRRSARLLRIYLKNQIRRFHPPALTALGEANLALGLCEEALKPLTECMQFFPRDPHVYRSRLLAAEANVELGRFDRAKELLIENLENGALTPRSPDWRDSLYALGRIHYREGIELETGSRLKGVDSSGESERKTGLKSLEAAQEYLQAGVARLSEAVRRDQLSQRDPFAPETLEAQYLLADLHRQIAKLPLRRINVVAIETTKNRLNADIQQELSFSADAYRELQILLNDKQQSAGLSPVESRMLRNTYFAQADVLYDLKRFDDAVEAYATATNRYQQEPEALEAYVQIANCHRLMNRHSEARGTLEQAKVVLNRIRQDADFARTTRYNREEWERLLDWLTTL